MMRSFPRHYYLPHVLFLSVTWWFFEAGPGLRRFKKTPEIISRHNSIVFPSLPEQVGTPTQSWKCSKTV